MLRSKAVRRGRARLIGIGCNARDGHTRVTRGEDFVLYRGDSQTHAKMQRLAMEFMRHVEDRGLSMASISERECREIAHAVGLRVEEIGVG
ncbi:MAG: hypothetical protein V1918_09740 [Planctomycetota bacterium]